MSQINQKLNELGIKIPEPAVPIANYVGFVMSGKNIFISGQLPIENGELKYIGKVGANISVEDAKKIAIPEEIKISILIEKLFFPLTK